MNGTPRFLLQDLVKQAQANAMDRARIAKEAAAQQRQAAECKCGKDPCECGKKEKDCCGSKMGSAEEVTTDYAMKLASAVEYAIPYIPKLAAPQAPPPHMTETRQEPGKGPNALHVMESAVGGSPPGPGQQGKATPANTPPTHTGTQKSTAAGPSTQVPNTINEPPGGGGTQQTAMPSGKGKTAEAVYAGNLEVLKKVADVTPGQAAALGLLSGGGGNIAGGVGAYHGARDAEEYGLTPNEGALRGGIGATLGSAVGSPLGAAGGGLAGAGLGGLAGAGIGALTGNAGAGAGVGAGIGGALGALGGGIKGGIAGGKKGYGMAMGDKVVEASAPQTLVDAFLATIKQAEDAINPAQISAGPAVEPDASQSGQGTPPTPNGSQMVGSNESAINYTKQQAKAEPKRDMSAYVSEPALASAHDNTLQQAFSHTGEAGVKMSSAETAAMQVSRARALLENIAAAATK